MRKLWIELVDYNSAVSLSGDANVIDTRSVSTEDYIRLLRTESAVKITNLGGLGYEADISANYVDPFGYVFVRNDLAQPSPSGNLNFLRKDEIVGPYDVYNAFVRLLQGKKLRLRYDPDGGAYGSANRMDGVVSKLLKGEVKAGRLECPFEFRGASPFYRMASKSETTLAANTPLNITPNLGELSSYKNAFTATIKINAVPSAHFSAQIYHSGSGFPVAQLELNKTLAKNDVVVWSSDPDDPRVLLNGVDQIFAGAVNLSLETFPSITGTDLRFVTGIATKTSFEFKAFNWSA